MASLVAYGQNRILWYSYLQREYGSKNYVVDTKKDKNIRKIKENLK